MIRSMLSTLGKVSALLSIVLATAPPAYSAPTAEVAKKCLRYAYRVYPYKRPGAAKASNGRQLYFNDCIAKNGDIPEPAANHQ